MSVYPQSHAYGGQPPFAAAPVYPQPHAGYQQYPPQMPPAPPPSTAFHHMDPVTFRRDYMTRLSELTYNCRPIIQNLSMIAQDYTRFAEIVAQCLETHIRRVPPWVKLPAFYVLDAISKNVYEPYARHFTSFVAPLFLETYHQVDPATRSKMEEMLLTWRNSAPNGKELFGVVPQVGIERGIWGSDSTASDPISAYSGQVSKAQVISELEFTLGQKQRALQTNPYDTLSQTHVNVLQQLRKLVEAGVSQGELQQILSQLRALVKASAPPPPAPVPTPHAYPSSSYPPQPSYPPPATQHAYPTAGPSYSHLPPQTYPPFVKSEPITNSQPIPSTSSDALPTGNISNLFNALVKAGVVSASSTRTGADATAKGEVKQQIFDLARESSREYRKAILSQSVRLSSADITKRRSDIVHFLFDRLPSQCKQCGIRFADSSVGKRSMENHLDMHFRQNRKANQNIGRGHSRSWFVSLEDWTQDISGDVKGKGRADGSRPMNSKAAAAAEAAKRDAELRSLHVVVPPGDEAKSVSCPICKETLKSEFLEDDEDWVWKNTVMKDDRIYHATCHAEAVASTNSLAARLRSEMTHGSRSGTPESRSTPPRISAASGVTAELRQSHSPPPESKLAGTKRKADSQDQGVSGLADGSPAMKKLALALSVTA